MRREFELLVVILFLVSNFVFSVGVIFANKILYNSYNVPPISLASGHFMATFLGLILFWAVGGFKIKSISVVSVLPISVAFCSFVVFTNFSLKYNSVGTYQILKCLGDPLLIVLQTLLYNKVYPTRIKLTLAIMVAGIVLNSMFDATFSMIGTVYALIAVVGSTFYFIWIGAKQEELEVSPLQLLVYQAPISSILLIVVVFFLEPPCGPEGIIAKMDEAAVMVIVSMVMACGVNITVFYIIRHTSVVTYAVFSKLKTCVVILGGSVLFAQAAQTPAQIAGIFLTLLGTVIYTVLKLLENRLFASTSRPSSPTKEVEIFLEPKHKDHDSLVVLVRNGLDKSKSSP